MKLFFAVLAITYSFLLTSAEVTSRSLDQLFVQFLKSDHPIKHEPPSCLPRDRRPQDCTEFVKSKLSSYEYDDESEYIQIVQACRYNFNDECIKAITNPLAKFEYDDLGELTKLANSCSYVESSSCIDVSMSFLPSFEYNDPQEVIQIAQSCRGYYDIECVKYICRASYNCNDLEEIVAVNKKCSGY